VRAVLALFLFFISVAVQAQAWPAKLKILTSPEVRERFAKSGIDVVAGTSEQFSTFLNAEVARWAKVIREADIKAD
jgi:tripartite-type tricarboxylate transporter receptor subunit TctC